MADQVKPNPERFWMAKACIDRSSDDEGHEELKEDLLKAAELVAKMRQLLESAEALLSNANCDVGICCCGDNMANHGNPMNCGHSPVDMGAYAAFQWLESYKRLTE